jgi:urease accessory protein
MLAHLETTGGGGWWAGVIHPMEAPDHLITLLLVGLLGGLAVRAGRQSWTLPTLFAVPMIGFGLIGVAFDRAFDLDPLLIAIAVVLGAMLFVHPRRTVVVAPVVAALSGALHGLAHSNDARGTSRPLVFVAGFAFTATLLLVVAAIVGSATGRSLLARRTTSQPALPADVDEGALV